MNSTDKLNATLRELLTQTSPTPKPQPLKPPAVIFLPPPKEYKREQ